MRDRTHDLIPRILALTTVFLVALWGPTLLAQTLTDPAVPPVPHQATDEWGGALVWAFLTSSGLEAIKRNKTLTFITEQSAWIFQRGVGFVLALATALGVHWSFDSTAGILTVTGLGVGMYDLGKEALRQWVLQELTYRTAVRPYRPAVTT